MRYLGFLLLVFISQQTYAGDFRLTGTNMGAEHYIQLQWDPSTLAGNYSYTVFQSDDGGVTFQSTSTNYDKTIKVLNVYPDVAGSNVLEKWMVTDGAGMGKISVTPVAITNFNADPDSYLKSGGKYQYDVIMFGSWDSNNSKDLTATSAAAVRTFLNTGRGVLFGHDTQTWASQYFSSLSDKTNMFVDMINHSSTEWRGSTQVKVINDGFLLKYPYTFPMGATLTVPYTHSTSQYAKGVVWMNFPSVSGGFTSVPITRNGGTNDFYLTTWNNAGLIQTGHTKGTDNITSATLDEKKILANTLWYLAQFTTETSANIRSVQDKAKPNLPQGSRVSGSQIQISDMDLGSPYQFYVKAVEINNGAIAYSDTISISVASGLKGYFISEDTNPAGAPTITRDASGNITTPLSIAAVDGQAVTYNGISGMYAHVQAVDNMGNLSDVKTVAPQSILTDKAWFFGTNVSGDMTSPGIIFDASNMPIYSPNLTKVNSKGTNFSTSINVCGNYNFYTTYDAGKSMGLVYNYKHEVMEGGAFPAVDNTTDGYAGAYIGDNKYAFFAVSGSGDLNYYIVDLSANGGQGEVKLKKLVANNVTQGIELVAKCGTTNEYWLVYYLSTSKEMKVELLSGETLTPSSTLANPMSSTSKVLAMVRSPQNNRIACLYNDGWDLYFGLFTFDANTGQLMKIRSTEIMAFGNNGYFSLSFTPDNDYCVAAYGPADTYLAVVKFLAGDTRYASASAANAVGGGPSIPFPKGGGGLKLGPDNIMYQKTDEYVFQLLWDKDNIKSYIAVSPLIGDNGMNFSIGLTPPAIDPSNISSSNNAPVAVDDAVEATIGTPLLIQPILNDTDPDGDKLFLSNVDFAIPADATKGSFTVDYSTKTVTFTPSTTYAFVGGETVVLNYQIRDSVVMNSLCATAKIVISIGSPIEAHDDRAVVFACGQVLVDVLKNDQTDASTSLTLVAPLAKKGTASVNTNKVLYNHAGVDCATKTGSDTLHYKICSNGSCSQARVVVTILEIPTIVLIDSCSFHPQMVLNLQYSGNAQWQYSTSNSSVETDWVDLPCTNVSCKDIKEGWYRVKVSYAGVEAITAPKHLTFLQKTQLPGGMWYQVQLSDL